MMCQCKTVKRNRIRLKVASSRRLCERPVVTTKDHELNSEPAAILSIYTMQRSLIYLLYFRDSEKYRRRAKNVFQFSKR